MKTADGSVSEGEHLRTLLAEAVRERENYNGKHQAACLEIERLRELLGQERIECANTAQATGDALGAPDIGHAIAKAIRARPIVTY